MEAGAESEAAVDAGVAELAAMGAQQIWQARQTGADKGGGEV